MANKFKNAKVQTVTADFFLVNPEKLISCPDRSLEQGLREIQKELWVRKWVAVAKTLHSYGKIIIAREGPHTVVAITHDRIPHVGWAKCSPADIHSKRVGIAVATARAHGEPIPDYI